MWRVTYAEGKEVSRERIGAGATTPAKPKVVKVGTKKKDAPAAEAGDDAGDKAKSAPAVSGGAVWDKLAKCEAGGDWSTNSGNGYYGGLQFDTQTWNAYDGDEFAPRPDQASREEQITVANKIKDDRGGYSAWPSCSSKLGLS
ncbi:transglycosylase family protein [Pseudonocardia sp. KRD-291]|nr:transglycosylase family protein [Pseudonocardia sp. KRD291]